MSETRARRLAVIGFVLWMAAHVFWIFRTEINWDEFALLARASDSLLEGRLIAGGRPGLATVLLMPIVEGCRNTVETVVAARLAWTPFVAGILLGLWFFLERLFAGREHRSRDALLGVALLGLTPAFISYSLQVRTDQPAIALGLLGGVALLASRHRPWLAVIAGLAFGLGYSSSQKLLYVAGLVGFLAVADSLFADRFRWRRDLARTVLLCASGLATVLAFEGLVSLFMVPTAPLSLEGQQSWFAFYREAFGYGYYLLMLPRLVVPVGLMLLVVALMPISVLKRDVGRTSGMMAVGVVVLGLLVMLFHAGALPYFWMTLGLYPAVAVAVGMPVLRERLSGRARMRLFALAIALLVATAAVRGARHSGDGLATQRESMALVERNFPADAEGFHATHALFCRAGTEPFPVFFGRTLYYWHEREGAVQEFLAEFRDRPISFIVASPRLRLFPEAVRGFFSEHYVPYSGTLMIPGIELDGPVGTETGFDVLVPGAYTIHAEAEGAVIEVDGEPLRTGERRHLERGLHEVRLQSSGPVLLTLDVPSPPGPTTDLFFTRF